MSYEGQTLDYESPALTAELQAHLTTKYSVSSRCIKTLINRRARVSGERSGIRLCAESRKLSLRRDSNSEFKEGHRTRDPVQ